MNRYTISVDAINDAINTGKQISFQYYDFTGLKEKVLKNKGEVYNLSPYHLLWNGDYYYVIGYSEKREKVVTFRVDRFGEDVITLAYDMTSFRLITEVSASQTFFGWVFGFGGKVQILVFPKDTIVLDKFLLSEKEHGRCRFTMAHEASHHILSKMYIVPSAGRFHTEYDSERSYSKEELAQMFASAEWRHILEFLTPLYLSG